jgi:hypothetical protein
MPNLSKLVSMIWYRVGRFEMLVGIFSLGLATTILALSRRNGVEHPESNPSLGLMGSLLATALNLYSKTKRGSRNVVNRRDSFQS